MCTRIKPPYYALYALPNSLQVPLHKQASISLDLITGLPIFYKFNALLIVVNYLFQIAYYIMTTTEVNLQGIACLFLNNIFHLYSLPKSIGFNCRIQFISQFTCLVTDLLGIQLRVSTIFYLQTDSKTEYINTIIKQYLYRYYNYQQDKRS